jgi:protein-S-isoprenylcysteine O-methyltransferase Ste14
MHSPFMATMRIPWVDRALAIVASVPFAIELYHRWLVGHVSFPRAVLGAQILVLIVMMALRSAPVRITPNRWFWLLALISSYGTLAFMAFAPPGLSLITPVVGDGLAVFSVIVRVYSLLSLGKSIGLVPAQRVIVTHGTYRFVRHPMALVPRSCLSDGGWEFPPD